MGAFWPSIDTYEIPENLPENPKNKFYSTESLDDCVVRPGNLDWSDNVVEERDGPAKAAVEVADQPSAGQPDDLGSVQ